MNPIYPLDLPDVKAYLAMNPDDTSQDSFIQDCIEACSDMLDQWLPFSIIERDIVLGCDTTWCIPGTEVVITLANPVLEVRSVKRTDRMVVETALLPEEWVQVGNCIRILELPSNTIKVTIDYRVGSELPPAIRSTLLMMVRNRFERRDENPMTDAVMDAVRPFVRPNI